MFYVYILQCSDGKFYVGCTKDFKDRIRRHTRGEVNYTSTRLPFRTATIIALPNKYTALKFEDYLKTGSGRAFTKKQFL